MIHLAFAPARQASYMEIGRNPYHHISQIFCCGFSIFFPLKGLELLLIYYLVKVVAGGCMVPKVFTESFLPDFPSLH